MSPAHTNIIVDTKLFLLGVITVSRTEDTFTKSGYSYWNELRRPLDGHQDSKQHREAVTTLHLMDTQPPVSAMLNKQIRTNQLSNNAQLVIVIKALKFLSRQNLAVRGTTYKKVTFIMLFILTVKQCAHCLSP